jgi:glutathione S-transferase
VDYDAHVINIGKGEQFTSGFVALNPNSKIPTCLDREGPGGKPLALFESASICMYFCRCSQSRLHAVLRPLSGGMMGHVLLWVHGVMRPLSHGIIACLIPLDSCRSEAM